RDETELVDGRPRRDLRSDRRRDRHRTRGRLLGLVRAERLFGEETAGRGVRARAAAAADREIPALAALPFVRVRIPELLEHARRAPDVFERLNARIARADRQVPARVHQAFVRDETHARAGQTST